MYTYSFSPQQTQEEVSRVSEAVGVLAVPRAPESLHVAGRQPQCEGRLQEVAQKELSPDGAATAARSNRQRVTWDDQSSASLWTSPRHSLASVHGVDFEPASPPQSTLAVHAHSAQMSHVLVSAGSNPVTHGEILSAQLRSCGRIRSQRACRTLVIRYCDPIKESILAIRA